MDATPVPPRLPPATDTLSAALLEVLLFDEDTNACNIVYPGLEALGVRRVDLVACRNELYSRVVRDTPEVVIFSVASPSAELLAEIAYISRDSPRPLIMFSADDNPDVLRRSLEAGVTTYVYDGLAVNRIAPVVAAARIRFDGFSRLRRERDAARASLADRKLIERAKGILMRHLGLDEQDAYQRLRKLAMDRHVRMATLAATIVEAAQAERAETAQAS